MKKPQSALNPDSHGPGTPSKQEQAALNQADARPADPYTREEIDAQHERDGSRPGPVRSPAEVDAAFEAARKAMEKLRVDTPIQVVSIKPGPKSEELGLIARAWDGSIRTSRMRDWRTEEFHLRPGDHVMVIVLAGEDLEAFLRYEQVAATQRAAAKSEA